MGKRNWASCARMTKPASANACSICAGVKVMNRRVFSSICFFNPKKCSETRLALRSEG